MDEGERVEHEKPLHESPDEGPLAEGGRFEYEKPLQTEMIISNSSDKKEVELMLEVFDFFSEINWFRYFFSFRLFFKRLILLFQEY